MPTISIETDYDLTDEDMEEILKDFDDDDVESLLDNLDYQKSFKFGAKLLTECVDAGPQSFVVDIPILADIFESMEHEKFDELVSTVCDNEGQPLERMLLLSLLDRQHSADPETVRSIRQLIVNLFEKVDDGNDQPF